MHPNTLFWVVMETLNAITEPHVMHIFIHNGTCGLMAMGRVKLCTGIPWSFMAKSLNTNQLVKVLNRLAYSLNEKAHMRYTKKINMGPMNFVSKGS